ncbi:hypothetical protein [Cerasicoccus arenae]|uniref:Uncharacterized protein n=1 Tax=Cerasicoccus arenae TaxID=424488 RepID=A0A8J3GEH2_9BACT|nr:hypothetical protein [Cerasicoccus arenae]MBK1859613.1 hypothetical protein [Cerasicoccus arenae]GHC03579.1 hypothetical protein GCM10007047_20230 [Cerasicoccus arenae]
MFLAWRLIFTVLLFTPLCGLALSLRFISLNGSIHDDLYIVSGKNKVYIRADENVFSSIYDYDEENMLSLYRDVPDEKGVLHRKKVLGLSLPTDLEQGLVILNRNPAEDVTAICLPDSSISRPEETVFVINLSNVDLAFRLSEEDFQLSPGQSHHLNFDTERQRVVISLAAHTDDKWSLIFSNPIALRPGLRVLLLLRDGRPVPGRDKVIVDMLSFYDRPPPSESEDQQ